MAGRAKPTPVEAFELNIADAQWLLDTARALTNQRVRRLRTEMREKIGDALGIRQRDRASLDCIESGDVFVVIKPSGRVRRDHVKDLSPLYRQAVVAACAALETYVADAVLARIGPVVSRRADLPSRLGGLTLSISEWKRINDHYEYKGRGLREHVLAPRIRELVSTAPSQIGIALKMVGVDEWAKQVDGARSKRAGTTVKNLEELTKRRNRIAHQGDRKGYGRARISYDESQQYVAVVKEVAEAIEQVLGRPPRVSTRSA
jgi:hypothetical protein